MTNHTLRLYVATVTLLVFLTLWAAIAAKPWASPPRRRPDPRLLALSRWQHRLSVESRATKRLVDRRWATYRVRLEARRAQIRKVETSHVRLLAAARAEAARIAAAEAAAAARSAAQEASTTTAAAPVVAPTTAPAAPTAAPSSPTVVTLPPQVKIVTLPPASSPATTSSSSQP